MAGINWSFALLKLSKRLINSENEANKAFLEMKQQLEQRRTDFQTEKDAIDEKQIRQQKWFQQELSTLVDIHHRNNLLLTDIMRLRDEEQKVLSSLGAHKPGKITQPSRSTKGKDLLTEKSTAPSIGSVQTEVKRHHSKLNSPLRKTSDSIQGNALYSLTSGNSMASWMQFDDDPTAHVSEGVASQQSALKKLTRKTPESIKRNASNSLTSGNSRASWMQFGDDPTSVSQGVKSQQSASKELTVGQMANKKAIPLCLPNNIAWNPMTGETNKTNEPRTFLRRVPAAIEMLQNIKEPVCVVSIAGPCRDGKSYILGEVFGERNVFSIGHEMDPETMGLWMWIVPQKFKDSSGRFFKVVLLDSEGIGAPTAEGLNDNQIFTLTVLLASVLIYNSKNVPKRNDLNDLSFIVKLSQRIRIRSKGSGRDDQELFRNTFPFFIWLLRDVTQTVPKDCRDLNHYFATRVFKESLNANGNENCQRKVTESILNFFSGFEAFSLPSPTADPDIMKNITKCWHKLNPKFCDAVSCFKELLISKLVPKQSINRGEKITGEALGKLVQLYVDAINDPDTMPNVESAWTTFVTTKCSEARDQALENYDKVMNSLMRNHHGRLELPCDGEIILNNHEIAQSQSMERFEAETSELLSANVGKELNELMASFDKKLTDWKHKNAKKTETFCQNLLERLKVQHFDPVLARIRGRYGASVRSSDIKNGRDAIKNEFHMEAIGAKDVQANVFFKFNKLLVEEMEKYADILARIKDYDEKLAREEVAKAYQEEEKRRLEEHIAQLGKREEACQRKMTMLENKRKKEAQEMRQQAKDEKERLQNNIKMMREAGMKQQSQIQRQLDAAVNRERQANRAINDLRHTLDEEKKNAEAQSLTFQRQQQSMEQEARKTQAQLRNQLSMYAERQSQNNEALVSLRKQRENERRELTSLRNEKQSLQRQLEEANEPGFIRWLWKKIW